MVLLGLVVILGISIYLTVREYAKPRYDGMSVTYCLGNLVNHHNTLDSDYVNEESLAALREMGEDAVPYMVSCLKERDLFPSGSTSRKLYLKLWQIEMPQALRFFLPYPFRRDPTEYALVIRILGDIGQDARKAIPFLIQELNHGTHNHRVNNIYIVKSLSKIVPGSGFEEEAVEAIKKCLESPFPPVPPQMKNQMEKCIQIIEKSNSDL